jgi:purine-cytosine permease-like protein
MFGRHFAKVPRFIWSTVTVIIFTVCAIGGRAQLLTIFLNFLGLIGYWTISWIVITLEEHLIFRRKSGYNWADWNVKEALPIGHAALLAFLIGWAGAILGMYQTYYTGVIAALVGHGADVSSPWPPG